MRRALACSRIAAALWLAAAGAASGDCRAVFPPARVAEQLADPRYQSCDAVAQDYTEFLAEQGRLLGELRPAYRRKLGLEDGQPGDAQAGLRLREYDENNRKLLQVAAALRRIPAPAVAASAASAAAAEAGSTRAAARQRLKESRVLSQLLADRIAIGLDEFQATETPSYCKQDFVFRVSSELHAKLAACLTGD